MPTHWAAACCARRVDFLVGQGAERVVDDDRREIGHAERVALHLRFVQEFGRDDDRRRPAGGFEV